MDYSIYERLELLRAKKAEIKVINNEINKMKKEYDENMGDLSCVLDKKKEELAELSDIILSVRLGDLISEISWLSGVDVKNIHVSLETNVSLDELYNLGTPEILDSLDIPDDKKVCRVIRFALWNDHIINTGDSYNYVSFNYFMFLELDFNSIQADGKKLIEHCSVITKNPSGRKAYNEFVIDKDIDNVICDFDLGCVDHRDGISWYPADLFSQAIINCIQRQHEARVDKIRTRVK